MRLIIIPNISFDTIFSLFTVLTSLDFLKNGLVAQWSSFESFLEMKEFAKTVKITNDTAERCVKIISDYAQTITKNEGQRQYLLQLVQEHRKLNPGQTKNKFLEQKFNNLQFFIILCSNFLSLVGKNHHIATDTQLISQKNTKIFKVLSAGIRVHKGAFCQFLSGWGLLS